MGNNDPMQIGKLCRVVLLVRNFERSLEFYRDALGFSPCHAPQGGWVEFDTGLARICLRGPWEGMPFDERNFGRSPDELLFTVDDLQAAMEFLRQRGVSVAEPHSPAPGLYVAEFADPDGRRIALECRTS